MDYSLNTFSKHNPTKEKETVLGAIRKLQPYMQGEGFNLITSFLAILITSGTSLLAPIIIAHTINYYIIIPDMGGVLVCALALLFFFLAGLLSQYYQTITMGGVGRRILFNLRNALFNKIQSLPVAFFNQNKAGDLISRINNDTDQLNQFFSQALMQFMGNFFLIIGAAIFLLSLHLDLGAASLAPAAVVLVATQIISPWVKKMNLRSLQSIGALSGEVQESLENFKVIVAFNRLDYFNKKFNDVNKSNYQAAVRAGVANNIFAPLYSLASSIGQMVVIAYGIYLVSHGHLTIGLLVGFLLYVNSFYMPLRQIASIWSSFQLALAGFARIFEILSLESNMQLIPDSQAVVPGAYLLEFKDVSFSYPNGKEVLRDINLRLEQGKTYALVGPTGGGKTTTASLMARLYDPSKGMVLLGGKDIRSYDAARRVEKIGFITQEPFLFTGSVRDNIIYGNDAYKGYTDEQLRQVLENANLSSLLARFDQGLETKVLSTGSTISLGQKQLIAFIRAVLRNPSLLILDEATANIDTVTEQLLEQILQQLPASTTKVIIAHRLNTISNADEIYFVNSGQITAAGSMEHAVNMLLHGKRES